VTEVLPSRQALLLDLRKALFLTPALGLVVMGLAQDVGFGLAVTAALTVISAVATVLVWRRTPARLEISRDAIVVRPRRGEPRTWRRSDVGVVWVQPEPRAWVGGDVLRATAPTADDIDGKPVAPWSGERMASVAWLDRDELLAVLTANGWRQGTTMDLGRRPATRRRPGSSWGS
jgi:hypothetical protein